MSLNYSEPKKKEKKSNQNNHHAFEFCSLDVVEKKPNTIDTYYSHCTVGYFHRVLSNYLVSHSVIQPTVAQVYYTNTRTY